MSDADEANLEDRLKATDLVLKKLQDDLRRGEADQQLLDRLGWTEKDLQRFVDRTRQKLAEPPSESAAEQARRRQFEEMLKSLDLRNSGGSRKAADVPEKTTTDFGERKLPVPPEYRRKFEQYSKKLSQQKKSQ